MVKVCCVSMTALQGDVMMRMMGFASGLDFSEETGYRSVSDPSNLSLLHWHTAVLLPTSHILHIHTCYQYILASIPHLLLGTRQKSG